jgi:hypothetical protein
MRNSRVLTKRARLGTGSVRYVRQRLEAKSEPGAVATGQTFNTTESVFDFLLLWLNLWPVATAPGSDFVYLPQSNFH